MNDIILFHAFFTSFRSFDGGGVFLVFCLGDIVDYIFDSDSFRSNRCNTWLKWPAFGHRTYKIRLSVCVWCLNEIWCGRVTWNVIKRWKIKPNRKFIKNHVVSMRMRAHCLSVHSPYHTVYLWCLTKFVSSFWGSISMHLFSVYSIVYGTRLGTLTDIIQSILSHFLSILYLLVFDTFYLLSKAIKIEK